MLAKPSTRTAERRATCSRRPGRLNAPAEPASTHVVTPLRHARLSGSIPK